MTTRRHYSQIALATALRSWRSATGTTRAQARSIFGCHWVVVFQRENPPWDAPDVARLDRHTEAMIERLEAITGRSFSDVLRD